MNKFLAWIQNNDKKIRGVAEKIGLSTSTLWEILNKGKMPSLKAAFRIEKYTLGAITIYDWLDENIAQITPKKATKKDAKTTTIKKRRIST